MDDPPYRSGGRAATGGPPPTPSAGARQKPPQDTVRRPLPRVYPSSSAIRRPRSHSATSVT